MYGRMRFSKELWAVVNDEGLICWTSGGSSTSAKLKVYDTEAKAKKQALKNQRVIKLYSVKEEN